MLVSDNQELPQEVGEHLGHTKDKWTFPGRLLSSDTIRIQHKGKESVPVSSMFLHIHRQHRNQGSVEPLHQSVGLWMIPEVLSFLICMRQQTSAISSDKKLEPRSDNKHSGAPCWQMTSSTNTRATVSAFWSLMGKCLHPLC